MISTDIRAALVKLEKDILKLINEAERANDRQRPNGILRISTVKGKTRYYHKYTDENKKKHSHYISPLKDKDLISDLAQFSYNDAFLETAYQQLKAVRRALKDINAESLADVYGRLHNERKKLINPFVPDTEEFIRRWGNDIYLPGNFAEDAPVIISEKGERVRSKSEKIIADKYKLLDIPYKYEKPLPLRDRSRIYTVRPDFTTLNKRTLVQRYHEHLGKMDDPKYVKKNIWKLKLYEKNGIFIGDQLILTFETADTPLDMKHFELLIRRYLL